MSDSPIKINKVAGLKPHTKKVQEYLQFLLRADVFFEEYENGSARLIITANNPDLLRSLLRRLSKLVDMPGID